MLPCDAILPVDGLVSRKYKSIATQPPVFATVPFLLVNATPVYDMIIIAKQNTQTPHSFIQNHISFYMETF